MVGLQKQGISPSESARLVLQDTAPPARTNPVPTPPAAAPTTHAAMVDSIFSAAISMDLPQLELNLHRALGAGSAWTVYSKVLEPVLERIGEKWAKGEVSIAQEHFATMEIGTVVRNLVRLVRSNQSEKTVLLACIEDEDHELPLYGVALMAETLRWNTCILGARTPPEALADAVEHSKPQLVGLSVTTAMPSRGSKILFDEYAAACGSVDWLVGGLGAERFRAEIEDAGGRCFNGSTTDLWSILT